MPLSLYPSAEQMFIEGIAHYGHITPECFHRLEPKSNKPRIDTYRYVMIAICHLHGYGTPVNPVVAQSYLQVAAQYKSVSASYMLALLFRGPWAKARYSHLQTLEHLAKAAERDHTIAIMEMGDLHMQGHAYEGSGPTRAREYYLRAAKHGFKPAILALEKMNSAAHAPQVKAAVS